MEAIFASGFVATTLPAFFQASRGVAVDSLAPVTIPAERIVLSDRERELFALLRDVVQTSGCGTVLRVAGGWVRDKLLGMESDDIDIALDNMTGLTFANLIRARLLELGEPLHHIGVIQANPEQSKHLETVAISLKGFQIDLVNLRSEEYSAESRIPTDVKFGSPLSDAQRRDLTINSLFFNLATGRIEDMTGRGLPDLDAGIIATPLAPLETLLDDPLRVLRALRFAARFDYDIDPGLWGAMADERVQARLEHKISRERVLREVTSMIAAQGSAPIRAMRLVHSLELYKAVFLADVDDGEGGLGAAERLQAGSMGALETLHALLAEAGALGLCPEEPEDGAARGGGGGEQREGGRVDPALAAVLRAIHASPTARRRQWIGGALLPLRVPRRTEPRPPSPELRKAPPARRGGRRARVVEEVMRHGLKGMTSHDVTLVLRTHDHMALFADLARDMVEPVDVKGEERLRLGLAIRTAGEHWREALVSALVHALPSLPPSPTGAEVAQWWEDKCTMEAVGHFGAVAGAIQRAQLEVRGPCLLSRETAWWRSRTARRSPLDAPPCLQDAWCMAPLLCGNEMIRLGVPRGPAVGRAMQALVEWQLRHPVRAAPHQALCESWEGWPPHTAPMSPSTGLAGRIHKRG